MRISHKYKFIWISKPKTGSVSYRKLLDPHSDIISADHKPFRHHATLQEMQETFQQHGWDFSTYFKVCAVRNPWDLLLSVYAYSKTDINGNQFWAKGKRHDPSRLMPFDQWISLEKHRQWFKNRHTLKAYTQGHNGEVLADLVFATDRDNKVFFTAMARRCNLVLDVSELGWMNSTPKSKVLLAEAGRCFSSQPVKSMMHELFCEEIEAFSYRNPYSQLSG